MEEGKAKEFIVCKKCGSDITSAKKKMFKGEHYCLSCYNKITESPLKTMFNSYAGSSQDEQDNNDTNFNHDTDSNNTSSENTYELPSVNSIGTILKIIGVCVIIAGIIVGSVIADELGQYGAEYTVALPYWIAGFVSGMTFLGLGEIINLLHNINKKL